MKRPIWVLLLALAMCGCRRGRSTEPPPAPAADAAAEVEVGGFPAAERAQALQDGAEVIKRHQCTRCHQIDGLPGTGRAYDCVSCHTFLLGLKPGQKQYEEIASHQGKDVLERYLHNIKHLVRVPNLTGIGRRLRLDFIASYLAAPFDVRPLLEESMIRNRLTPAEITTLTRYFAAAADVAMTPPPASPPPDPARVELGRGRFRNLGCPKCHTIGNLDLGTSLALLEGVRDQALLAPNLRFARDRLRPDVIVQWIVDPRQVQPDTVMEPQGVSQEDAELIRDYLLGGAFPVPPADTAAPVLPPAAPHAVGWAEVKERVLGKVCVHCHMNDHEKDRGVGNAGGFGYTGLGLSFRTYERAVYGAKGTDGTRHSVFVKLPGETLPRVLASMLARRVDARRDQVAPFADHERPLPEATLGMPLGLPAMSDEEFGILRRWIEDGCPGPTAVTGRSEVGDGFLVPDGPIEVNKGCGLRAPSQKRPAWAFREGPNDTPAPH